MTFNPFAAHAALAKQIAALSPRNLGLRARPNDLEAQAEYISELGRLVGEHIEAVMADAASSISCDAIAEQDAGFIIDAANDCAGQLMEAAERELEPA